MPKIFCKTCNKEFHIPPYRIKTAKYCSVECSPTVFKKGVEPWHKGTKGVVKPNSGSFKKGQKPAGIPFKKGRVPWNKGKEFPQIKGKNHGRWKGGITISDGYIYIYSPDHPFRSKQNKVALHRIIVEKSINRFLTPDEIIHHINENKQDNRIENLQICSRAEHLKIHLNNSS